jgi:hypothetical protein
MEEINVLGSGIILLFSFKKGIIANLLLGILLFGIFSLIANLMGGDLASTKKDCLD